MPTEAGGAFRDRSASGMTGGVKSGGRSSKSCIAFQCMRHDERTRALISFRKAVGALNQRWREGHADRNPRCSTHADNMAYNRLIFN